MGEPARKLYDQAPELPRGPSSVTALSDVVGPRARLASIDAVNRLAAQRRRYQVYAEPTKGKIVVATFGPTEAMIYVLLVSRFLNFKTWQCNPSTSTVATAAGCSYNTAQKALLLLEAAGAIASSSDGPGRGRTKRYSFPLIENPQSAGCFPEPENTQRTGCPTARKHPVNWDQNPNRRFEPFARASGDCGKPPPPAARPSPKVARREEPEAAPEPADPRAALRIELLGTMRRTATPLAEWIGWWLELPATVPLTTLGEWHQDAERTCGKGNWLDRLRPLACEHAAPGGGDDG